VLALQTLSKSSNLPESAGYGPNPQLPEYASQLIPTFKFSSPKGWAANQQPQVAAGLKVNAFARDLDHPRWLYVLPNGDVLVAETNAPAREGSGPKAWAMKQVMRFVGAAGKSADRITLLRDTDGDGISETRAVFLQGLHSPFGMALIGGDFYVANTDAVMRFPYEEGATNISNSGTKVADLPATAPNLHWTKNLLAAPDGKRLYVTVGSNSNVGDDNMENEVNRAAILEINLETGVSRVFASGLRNPNGLAWEPQSQRLWTAVNERDSRGNDLVPDYITAVRDGGFYGWPYSYYGQNVDTDVEPQDPALVARALVPDYAVGAHTAPLGLTFASGRLLPERLQNGAFVALHGSWNRKPPSGYKVIFVPFANGAPNGAPEDILTGFLGSSGDAFGRPVGVAMGANGALLVADDVGNTVWRVAP
jgi:glucose/arabinose dehydrogenase